jgi:hypothetical protein
MTKDQALAKANAELDVIFERILDDTEILMIDQGATDSNSEVIDAHDGRSSI